MTFLTYEIGEESIIVVRGFDQQLRAFFNVCRHRGSQICLKKNGNIRRFVCPYHAWAYDLDGKLISARHMADDFDHSQHGLHRCQVEVLEGLIFISLASQGNAEFRSDQAQPVALSQTAWFGTDQSCPSGGLSDQCELEACSRKFS